MSQFFNKQASQNYDDKNSKLASISDCMHFLIRLTLKDLPQRSRILCVGVGTGAEILSLSKEFPQWTFVGLDPSESMLEVCRERLEKAGVLQRCELIVGYIQDLPSTEQFDAVLSILVGHFVKPEERLRFYTNMVARTRKDGYFIDAEISFDLESPEFTSMLKNWEQVQSLMGATTESLASLPTQLKEILTVLPPHRVERLMIESGIKNPIRFFQAFMISAWYGIK